MRIYVAMEDSLLVAAGDPGEWTAERRLTDHDPESVLVTDGVALCGTFDAGLQRSADGGDTWERVGDARDESADGKSEDGNTGTIEPDSVMSLAAHPEDPSTVWAGTEPSRLYRSRDGGRTWTHLDGLADLPSAEEWYFPPRPDTHHVRWVEADPDDPEHLYVGIEAGALVQTHDGGETWEDRVPSSRRDNHTLAVHPDAPDRVWSAAGDGYAESQDAGESWKHPMEGLEHTYCWGLAVDPGDPGTVLLSAASGANAAHRRGESYLYRKRDGEAWERLDDRGVPTGEGVYRAVLAAGEDPGEVLAANNHGVYRTRDAGDSWTRLEIPWPEAYGDQTVRGLAIER